MLCFFFLFPLVFPRSMWVDDVASKVYFCCNNCTRRHQTVTTSAEVACLRVFHYCDCNIRDNFHHVFAWRFWLPLHFLLLLIWVMLIADADYFFLRYQQATMSCHFVIIHANCKCEQNAFGSIFFEHLQSHLLRAKKKKNTNISFRYTGHCFTPKLMCFCQAQCHKIHNFKVNGNAPSVLLPTV